jgi:hypothetical protein
VNRYLGIAGLYVNFRHLYQKLIEFHPFFIPLCEAYFTCLGSLLRKQMAMTLVRTMPYFVNNPSISENAICTNHSELMDMLTGFFKFFGKGKKGK